MNKEFYDKLSVLEMMAAEKCTGLQDCCHCSAQEAMERIYMEICEAVEAIQDE